MSVFAGFVGDAYTADALVADARDEFWAVEGDAAGLGRNEPGAGNAAQLHFRTTDFKGGQGAVDGGLTKPSGLGQALAKAHDAREGVNDSKPLPRRAGDEEAAIVGAQIQRGVDMAAPSGSLGASTPARTAIPLYILASGGRFAGRIIG